MILIDSIASAFGVQDGKLSHPIIRYGIFLNWSLAGNSIWISLESHQESETSSCLLHCSRDASQLFLL
jgi:hypothetical protein